MTKEKCGKLSFAASALFHAQEESQEKAGFGTSECLAVFVETVSAHLHVLPVAALFFPEGENLGCCRKPRASREGIIFEILGKTLE